MEMSNGSDGRETRALGEIFQEFRQSWNSFLEVYDLAIPVTMSLGLFGGLLALCTMSYSKRMQTPSFTYHRALVWAKLACTLNWFMLEGVNRCLTVRGVKKDFVFGSYTVAFFSGIISRVIYSTCGYMVLYATVFIGVDRFMALCLPFQYRKFNHLGFARTLIFFGFILAFFLNSWSAWFENTVTPILCMPNNISLYTWVKLPSEIVPQQLFLIKNIFNATLRLLYPILLTFLTLVVVWFFRRRIQCRKHAVELRESLTPRLSRRIKKQQKRDSYLFYLMLSAVLFAIIQVVPSETYRLVKFLYPYDKVWMQIRNSNVTLEEKMKIFTTALYWQNFGQLFANFSICVDRSMIFYVYFALNPSFRRESLRFLKILVGKFMSCPFSFTGSPKSSSGGFTTTGSTNRNSSNNFRGQKRKTAVIQIEGRPLPPTVAIEIDSSHLVEQRRSLPVPTTTKLIEILPELLYLPVPSNSPSSVSSITTD